MHTVIAVENSSYQMRKVKKKVRQQKSEATQKVRQLFIEEPEKEANFLLKVQKKNQKSHKLNLSTPACKKYNKDSILLNAFHWIF